jgi:hypothetical protein
MDIHPFNILSGIYLPILPIPSIGASFQFRPPDDLVFRPMNVDAPFVASEVSLGQKARHNSFVETTVGFIRQQPLVIGMFGEQFINFIGVSPKREMPGQGVLSTGYDIGALKYRFRNKLAYIAPHDVDIAVAPEIVTGQVTLKDSPISGPQIDL